MEFIRSILIIDKLADQAAQIKKQIQLASHKFSIFTLDSRLKIAELTNQNNIRFLFLNSNIGKKDTLFILRFFYQLKEKNNFEVSIYFTSEDFEFLQEVVAEFPFKKFQIMHTPLDINDLVDKLQIDAFGKLNAKNTLDVDLEFMSVFITSTKKIISEMAKVPDLKHSKPMLMSQVSGTLDIAISAKILISSEYFKGSYYIAFPKQTFLNFYEIVVMEKCVEINSENKDFASELANIIYGQCKKKFSEMGFKLEMVIPSLHMGEINYSVVVLIPFESSVGKFYLAIAPGLI